MNAEKVTQMKKGSILLIIVLGVLGFSSCYDFPLRCIRGNGNLTSEYRNHTSFHQIVSTGSYDVLVEPDSVYEVLIEGEENLIPYIETQVRNSKLYIDQRDNRCLRTNYPIVIRIKLPEITGVNLTGSGDIVCDSVNTEYFYMDLIGSGEIRTYVIADFIEADLVGSGDIEISGEAMQTELSIPGSGSIRALNLLQNECDAEIAGSGNIWVTVSEFLGVRITGSGNVYYQGDPALDIQIIGSGNVIPLND